MGSILFILPWHGEIKHSGLLICLPGHMIMNALLNILKVDYTNLGVQILDKGFKLKCGLNPAVNNVEGLFSGPLLGVQSKYHLMFYDFSSGYIVRRIECVAKQIKWNPSGTIVAICTSDKLFILQYHQQQYINAVNTGSLPEDGVEQAFSVIYQNSDAVTSALFVENCLIYTTKQNKLNYVIKDINMAITTQQGYLVGYQNDVIYLLHKDQFYGFNLPLNYIQILLKFVVSNEADTSQLTEPYKNKLARFLEGLNKHELALDISQDIQHKFDLAIHLKRLNVALQMCELDPSEEKYKLLSQIALQNWEFEVAERCLLLGNDVDHLLLFYSCQNNTSGLQNLIKMCKSLKKYNVAFNAAFLLKEYEVCCIILQSSNLYAEACLMARQYVPHLLPNLIEDWKSWLVTDGTKESEINDNEGILIYRKKLAERICDVEDASEFPDHMHRLFAEKLARQHQDENGQHPRDFLKEAKAAYPNSAPPLGDITSPMQKKVSIMDEVQEIPPYESASETPESKQVEIDNMIKLKANRGPSSNTVSDSMEVNTTGTGSVKEVEDDYKSPERKTFKKTKSPDLPLQSQESYEPPAKSNSSARPISSQNNSNPPSPTQFGQPPPIAQFIPQQEPSAQQSNYKAKPANVQQDPFSFAQSPPPQPQVVPTSQSKSASVVQPDPFSFQPAQPLQNQPAKQKPSPPTRTVEDELDDLLKF
eukprot:NODE_202_length_13094_cov_1.571528.p1 type:complete len:704 gc:universal NODE_202_length_13094_cov_1.571528:12923-10812(-)